MVRNRRFTIRKLYKFSPLVFLSPYAPLSRGHAEVSLLRHSETAIEGLLIKKDGVANAPSEELQLTILLNRLPCKTSHCLVNVSRNRITKPQRDLRKARWLYSILGGTSGVNTTANTQYVLRRLTIWTEWLCQPCLSLPGASPTERERTSCPAPRLISRYFGVIARSAFQRFDS